MDKNQAIKNKDDDLSLLSLSLNSLNERLYLSDTILYCKSGFKIYRPQAQKIENNFYQEPRQNDIQYSQSNSLQQIDQAKYQALNGSESQRKTNEDFELVRNKLEMVHNSVNNLRNELAHLQETVNKNNSIIKDQQAFSQIIDKKSYELNILNEKFENFMPKLALDIETTIKKTVNDAVLFLEQTFDNKMGEQIKHAELKTKIDSCKKLSSIKKLNENGVRKRQTIQTDVINFSNSLNDKFELDSNQESVGSLFEFEV